MANHRLSVVDYVIFATMLVVCGAIGLYHAIRSKRQQTTANFLMADHSMGKFPIAMSLLVSFLSAIAILGIPSEVYTYGISYVLVCIAFVVLLLVSAFLYVPVFYKLKITSTNEYLEKRFTPGIRLLGSILFLITYTMYLSIALFAPALALETVSGFSVVISIVLNGVVCVFYTSLGGLKAVIWTDVFQGFVILGGMVCIFIIGTVEVNGFSNVWKINREMNRTQLFNFDPDPTIRSTFWTFTVGGTFTYLYSWSVSQLSVQRFLASKSLKEAQRAVLINIPVFIFIAIICSLDGLVIFAVYSDCDLRKERKITGNDQILPYFVVNKLGDLKGVPGLFIAALFSGSLSTVSSGVNSLTAIILEDIIKKIKKDIPDSKATFLSKVVGIIYGAIIITGAIALRYAKVPLLIQLTASLFNISAGPLLGLFTLGMISKRANWKGAYVGTVVSFILVGWIYIGSIFYPPNRHAPPISVKECRIFNASLSNVKVDENYLIHNKFREHGEPLAGLYGLSFLYYGAVGMWVTIIIGLLFSLIVESSADRQADVDKRLLFQLTLPKFSKFWKVRSQQNHTQTGSSVLERYNAPKESIQMGSISNNGFVPN